ncbi:MAG: response regulator [bacterium]|nr:response regulator [bacterium]
MEKAYKILIVDDEVNALSALAQLLRKEPYEIMIAGSALGGLNKLYASPVDLVISDFKMPVHDGVEFLKRVAMDYPDTIRIILTGHADLEAAIAAINEGGVYRFLTKPWNDQDLLITIRLALEHLQLQRENRSLAAEVREQHQILKDLEKEYPGIRKAEKEYPEICKVEKDEKGTIII